MATLLHAERPARRRGLATILVVTAVLSAVFVGVFAARFFVFTEAQYGDYWPHRWWLFVHLLAGIGAVATGPVQLWLGLRDRRMDLHRTLGTVYMTCIAIGTPTGLYLAITTRNGFVAGTGLAALALAWALTTGMAYLAVRRHLYDQHKEWMIRSYVVTLAFVTVRFGIGLSFAAGKTMADFPVMFGAAVWAGWALPLLFTEVILQGRKILAVRS